MKFTLVSAAAIVLTAQQVLAGGPIAGCLQTHTVVAGDSCVGIAANFKLTPDEFYAMNPGLHHLGDHICDNLDDGKPYCVCTKKPCVAESNTSGNSTVGGTTSGTAATSAPPTPTSSVAVTPSSSSSPSSSSPSSGSAAGASSSGSGSSSSASNTHSAANALVVPTMMMGLVGMAVAALL
ncbi:unnamed protein product [Cunninghamella blakesleeana]